jgi:hypothetical protein
VNKRIYESFFEIACFNRRFSSALNFRRKTQLSSMSKRDRLANGRFGQARANGELAPIATPAFYENEIYFFIFDHLDDGFT